MPLNVYRFLSSWILTRLMSLRIHMRSLSVRAAGTFKMF